MGGGRLGELVEVLDEFRGEVRVGEVGLEEGLGEGGEGRVRGGEEEDGDLVRGEGWGRRRGWWVVFDVLHMSH